ncbi:hypothetical protein Nocox_37275 [Nonomuraea coxensis DSM 45129]|uniref:Lipoprotein n=1 Tax=Nonomuraea coxensis DSM 45129 TaxID=1122611 RepID=A0ABX8UDX9_9ACTN|nr:hypothetical protein [Nonomuraea coxensis]QYC45009.1 hypothetical protein Nocox_37275 [Nonomuraea coxensis DSM 45129]
MRRSLACATATVLAAGAFAVPARAATPATPAKVVYGYAWPDGKGHLRVVPKSATLVKKKGPLGYRLTPIAGAKEVRLDYTKAAVGRVTVACGLKETEGQVALDAKGLGRTRCKPADLAASLESGARPLRVEFRGGRAVRVNEILVSNWPNPRTARGTIARVDDRTVLFVTGGKTYKLGYSYLTYFYRTTARCKDGWLAGRPVHADRNGLGTQACDSRDLARALRSVEHPVLAKLRYSPETGGIDEVWEVYGDA